ncbi:Ser/Thr protein kinase RdoA (MazF antagonist) [Actinoplanes tereljensis]|uniref:Aminoglycoside phosphotransferase n=1 Tax=Paractinoplanes tereljensis TaxID=571912 RepID=A0A919TV84_9ACTN|nr:phosphotransferase [Actinoplanes tereljensis]GIF23059.1 aminoglycoside phosphotransferase [Actinoplanes tereljensis]
MSTAHDLSAGDRGFLDRLAARAVREYGYGDDVELTLLNVSENATFLVQDAATGARTVLRVHRRGYHGEPQIASELAWLDALRDEAGLRTPRVVPAAGGRRIVDLEPGAEPRHAVMFEWLPGAEPPDHDLVTGFGTLGALTARMHEHSRTWRRPAGFDRFAWDYDGAFGRVARWGRWQDGIAVGPAERAVLGRLDEVLRSRLAAFGRATDRYGLVHADLRLANLLVHGSETFVIDFDDCGWGWLLYDLGAALSFIEDDPRVPALVDAWVAGYRTVRPLAAADEAEIPTFVLMRRLLLVAWIGSHAGTDLARSMGAAYTAGSCELAETYLSTYGRG